MHYRDQKGQIISLHGFTQRDVATSIDINECEFSDTKWF